MSKFRDHMNEYTRVYILEKLVECDFNTLKVSRKFGINRATISTYCGNTDFKRKALARQYNLIKKRLCECKQNEVECL